MTKSALFVVAVFGDVVLVLIALLSLIETEVIKVRTGSVVAQAGGVVLVLGG